MIFGKKPAGSPLIKNARGPERRRDFTLNAVGVARLAFVAALLLSARLILGPPLGAADFAVLLGAPAVTTGIIALFPRWSVAVKLLIIVIAAAAVWASRESGFFLAFAAAGAILAPSVQRLEEWERGIILRFGKYHSTRGPGLFSIFPIADRIAKVVDLRIRVTDFAAETTLTRDSVTVTVDALCFWLVWDAEKAVCEVQDYEEAVVLSSKTALRNAVSKNDLSVFLERGDEIEEQIRAEVDKKTTEWGITVQHIEITDIQIPEGLQDSLSRLAQAEREKKGRVLLAEAEIEVARKFEEAARVYASNGTAMKLKSLSILNEGLRAGNSMMLVPSSITEELAGDDVFGLQALAENRAADRKRGARKPKEADDGSR